MEVFKDFYALKTKHRKLTWIYSLGSCNISGKFDAKTIELVVSTNQVWYNSSFHCVMEVKAILLDSKIGFGLW